MKRRNFIQLGAIGPLISSPLVCTTSPTIQTIESSFKHSICRWCYNKTPLEELSEKAKSVGVHSIELLHAEEWRLVQKKGLQCAVGYANDLGLTKGFNDTSLHAQLLEDYSKVIPMAASDGIPNIICFSGNANGLSEEEGLENCAEGLDPILKIAEKYNINIIMELLNSKVDHKDYQCDHTEWGVKLVDKLGSDRFKLLYDIYHMQIMEGDLISTITKYKDYIAHFHTGGVPGRNEIDETQEINYTAIMEALKENNFDGFVAQEYIPTWEKPFEALSKAIEICTV
ncbi:MAG: TIM barrel protein [Saprospiraceae bacterium]|nr:TIM barrel protein [Bacteroidia bacterium]NNE14806.1 TIM barrel protein [Saprospiraceae bacterium]NNL93187.1 TIM barrel protein [Saprospiraceae bacterium]